MKKHLLSYTFLFLLLAGTPLLAQKTVADFTLTDIDGNTYNLYEELAQGKAVVLDFFRYYCHACRESSQAVEGLWQDYKENNVWVWKIDIYDNETETQVRDFKEQFGGTMPSFLKGSNLFRYFVLEFGLQSATPGFIIILPDKTVAWVRAGFSEASMRSVLNENGFDQRVASVESENALAGINANVAPNPTIGNSTTLNLELDQPGTLQVRLFDGLGREVVTLVEGNVEAGTATIPVNTENLAAGLYYVRVEQDGKSITTTLTVVK